MLAFSLLYADDSYVYVSSPTTSNGHLEVIGADLIEMDNLGLFPKDRKVLSFCILGIANPASRSRKHYLERISRDCSVLRR